MHKEKIKNKQDPPEKIIFNSAGFSPKAKEIAVVLV